MEILEGFSGSSDHMIVKGKRSKRLRPSSSASSSGGGAVGGEYIYNSVGSHSPTTTSGISTRTEEDEDMANCLILLARGCSPPQETKAAGSKFSSRKFAEMATATGRVGLYVFECKTCNRTFPSFQALGGHRASHHKKPKPTADSIDQKKPPPATVALPYDQEEEEGQSTRLLNTYPGPTSTQLTSDKTCRDDQNHKPKIHECSICGSEFASGQALGGHMRKHRPAPPSASTRIGPSIDNDSRRSRDNAGEKPRNLLALDLNLPAPPEDDKFYKFPSKQQRHVVFSAAALVDCHN